ncbi:Putative Ubiquinol-cytochrome c reductase complex subunit [[Torrubiella] hemipterigena]|uniref:Cytochrome b-c1 complex subunit 6, mitochondrial n=1 Tax=[Torrubiella] hemipterigena TaxID=1531966 RepID=A0A0A1T191_9HYPO|nr:Putative Ubiquinol-cytochrome c reductase complex subunit [[Torrubiella] hemipterigena]
MGIWETFSEIVDAVAPWSVVEAEAPAEETQPAVEAETKEEEPVEEAAEETEEAEEAAEEEEEEEEEEDEDEIVDPKDVIEEECKNSAQCAPAKHHFDHCVERVQEQESQGEVKEDCVEEFFHLAHCATACAAPKLWAKLK